MCSKKKRSLRSLEHLFLWKHILTSGAGCLRRLRVHGRVGFTRGMCQARGLLPRSPCSVLASFCALKICILLLLLLLFSLFTLCDRVVGRLDLCTGLSSRLPWFNFCSDRNVWSSLYCSGVKVRILTYAGERTSPLLLCCFIVGLFQVLAGADELLFCFVRENT